VFATWPVSNLTTSAATNLNWKSPTARTNWFRSLVYVTIWVTVLSLTFSIPNSCLVSCSSSLYFSVGCWCSLYLFLLFVIARGQTKVGLETWRFFRFDAQVSRGWKQHRCKSPFPVAAFLAHVPSSSPCRSTTMSWNSCTNWSTLAECLFLLPFLFFHLAWPLSHSNEQ
jgi:hypothetical protein